MNANSFYELQRLLLSETTSCGTIAVPCGQRDVAAAASYIEVIFTAEGIEHRSRPRNRFLGYIASTPRIAADVRILGRSYWDERDQRYKEDLFEISRGQVRRLGPREAEAEYPEYAGTHWGDKSYLLGSIDQK